MKFWKKIIPIVCLGLLSCRVVGVCALEESVGSTRLRSGDTVEVRVGGVPVEEINQVAGTYTVDTEGFLNMPHIGRVKADGLTQGEVENAIEHLYVTKQIYTHPTVTVVVPLQYRFVTVGGEVRMPQRVPYTQDLTVLAAINAAGGFTEYASQGKVRLLRADKVYNVDIRQVRRDPSKDEHLQPGDTVEVLRSFF